MKKTLTFIFALTCALTVSAQSADGILSKIEASASRNIEGGFTEVRTQADKAVSLAGRLQFKTDGSLSMIYDNGEAFVIAGDKMTVRRDGTTMEYDLARNLMMKGLADVLRDAFTGKLGRLAEQQNCDISAAQSGKEYVVTLTAKKKSVRGLSCVEVRYDASTCTIKSMRTDEFTGLSTQYTLK